MQSHEIYFVPTLQPHVLFSLLTPFQPFSILVLFLVVVNDEKDSLL